MGEGYTVIASGEKRMSSTDIHACLSVLREHPKAELYRNADRQLLAYTTGMGPGRGRRIDE